MGVVAATLFELTDIAEWADSSDTEASDSGIETPGVPSKERTHSTNNDAKQSSDESVETSAKILKCISCDEPDEYLHPLMKECHSCWQKRRGNMPDRPKPKRKKIAIIGDRTCVLLHCKCNCSKIYRVSLCPT